MKEQIGSAKQLYTVPDRAMLRAQLETTRTTFHRQLEWVAGEDRWSRKSPTSAWTFGEVLVHLTGALEYLPKEVEMARQGKGMFNMPKWMADPLSYWLTRWEARSSDPESLRRRYDHAMDAVVAALDSVPDSDWGLGAKFYGHGFYSVADLFDTPTQHLAEHCQQP
jgi:hypothetical protein